MKDLIKQIEALKLKDDHNGLKQNAVIDKVVEILNRYACKGIYKRNGRAGNMLSCDKCGCVIATNYVYCANCGRRIEKMSLRHLTLSPKNEPKRIMPLQVKESDFKGDESHYYYNKNNFSFHIFIKPDNGFSLFYKHIKIFDEDVKQITLSEAVTAINDYLKQLYEEVQK